MNAVLDVIFVDNLNCEGCADTIRQALTNMIGVLNVHVNLAEGWVEVEHEDFTDPETIKTRLAEIGYPEVGTDTLLQKTVAYASCTACSVRGQLN